MQGGKRENAGTDGDEMLILVGNERIDRQPGPRLKREYPATETVRAQGTAGTVCEERALNAALRTSKADF